MIGVVVGSSESLRRPFPKCMNTMIRQAIGPGDPVAMGGEVVAEHVGVAVLPRVGSPAAAVRWQRMGSDGSAAKAGRMHRREEYRGGRLQEPLRRE